MPELWKVSSNMGTARVSGHRGELKKNMNKNIHNGLFSCKMNLLKNSNTKG